MLIRRCWKKLRDSTKTTGLIWPTCLWVPLFTGTTATNLIGPSTGPKLLRFRNGQAKGNHQDENLDIDDAKRGTGVWANQTHRYLAKVSNHSGQIGRASCRERPEI